MYTFQILTMNFPGVFKTKQILSYICIIILMAIIIIKTKKPEIGFYKLKLKKRVVLSLYYTHTDDVQILQNI